MTIRDQPRAHVLTRLIAGDLDVVDVATLLGLSGRQVWRLKSAFLERGPAARVHGNRGRASPRRLAPELRERVVTLARTSRVSGLIFDEAPWLYDRYRPGYPGAVVDALMKLACAGPGSQALEVGAGTGQLTIPLAMCGLAVTALEPGLGLARRLARKLDPYRDSHVITSRFEDAEVAASSFDVVVAATAFHHQVWLALQAEDVRRQRAGRRFRRPLRHEAMRRPASDGPRSRPNYGTRSHRSMTSPVGY